MSQKTNKKIKTVKYTWPKIFNFSQKRKANHKAFLKENWRITSEFILQWQVFTV